ncbi:MAG TPA: MOSC N-terminal beta barrel domain-containing protein [Gemmatimonadaceae bacterium]
MAEVGHVEAIFRYPVKSMRGERLESAALGWHGIEGDRRLALRRTDDRGGFPWLTATKFADLILFAPQRRGDSGEEDTPTHVSTPDGEEMPVFGEKLAAEIERRCGTRVQMMQMRQGVFDETSISVIASETVREICSLAGCDPDVRRFRPNVVVHLARPTPFQEDDWVGGTLSFGEEEDAPAVAVTMRDVRCAMLNLDPDTASRAPEVMKAVVRVHENTAGIYATVTRTGRLAVGQRIFFRATETSMRPLPVDE